MIKKIIQFPFHLLGLELARKERSAPANRLFTCYERLENAARLGYNPKVIFDCGAHLGNWTLQLSNLFNDAFFVAFEPNPILKDDLIKNLDSRKKLKYKLFTSAVGSQNGSAKFNIWESVDKHMTGSSLQEHIIGKAEKQFEVEVKTLDSIATALGKKPDLIKLDLQGSELEALKGAKELLQTTEMCIIEFGCLEAYINRTTPKDLMEIMFANDYCLYDVTDLIYRPYDGALTGGDFFFVKNSSQLRKYKKYS